MEPVVLVQAREQDYDLVEKAIAKAAVEFEAHAFKVTATINKQSPLPKESYGGVIVGTPNWNIKVANTLESRLELLQEQVGEMLS